MGREWNWVMSSLARVGRSWREKRAFEKGKQEGGWPPAQAELWVSVFGQMGSMGHDLWSASVLCETRKGVGKGTLGARVPWCPLKKFQPRFSLLFRFLRMPVWTQRLSTALRVFYELEAQSVNPGVHSQVQGKRGQQCGWSKLNRVKQNFPLNSSAPLVEVTDQLEAKTLRFEF